jgi:hypothetical protein
LRVFTTITDEERATINAQTRKLGRPILGLALVGYVCLLVGFSYARPQFIASLQPYLFNPPDFAKCEPTFSARLTAHILFTHLVFGFCSLTLLVSMVARYENAQLNWGRLRYFAALWGGVLFGAIPALFRGFLFFTIGKHSPIYSFSDFCVGSWNWPAMAYLPILGFWLIYSLVAIVITVSEFVWSGNKGFLGALSTDPETRAEQLVTRLEYGAITQEEFDAAAKQFHLK